MRSPRILIAAALAVVALVAVVRLVAPPPAPAGHEVLRSVYSPRFDPVRPPAAAGDVLATIWEQLRSSDGQWLLRRWVPDQAGTLWIALLVVLVVGFDFEHPRNPRNIDLLAAYALGVLFFDILWFADHLRQPVWLALLWRIFDGVVTLSLILAARAVWRATHPWPGRWRPAMSRRALMWVAILTLAMNMAAAAFRAPDDAGHFVNLGAQRLRERGLLPYGDPLLTGTPGAAYGPLLYVAHLPFQLLVDPQPVNRISTPRPPLGTDSRYYLPSPLANKFCVIAFQVLAAAALFFAGRRFDSSELGWTIVALYCGSAFMMGMGGDQYFIGGMTYVSHIGPAAVLAAAFAALSRPAWAGLLLVAAAGCGFFPAFLAPAWAGYYWTRKREFARFLVGAAIASALLIAFVLLLSRPAGDRGLVGTILWDTFGHHSDPAGYGASPYGFWGQRTGLKGWLIQPLVGSSGLTAPAMLLFFAFAASCFFLARARGARELALLSAAVVIGATLVKIHSTGTYVAWYYGLLLLGLFLPPTDRAMASGRMNDST